MTEIGAFHKIRSFNNSNVHSITENDAESFLAALKEKKHNVDRKVKEEKVI